MGRLVIDGNKVYTVDESCMRRKKLTIEKIQELETHETEEQKRENGRRNRGKR